MQYLKARLEKREGITTSKRVAIAMMNLTKVMSYSRTYS